MSGLSSTEYASVVQSVIAQGCAWATPPNTMPYAVQTIYLINKGPRNLGNSLGRLAANLDFSVLRIAKATGATRQTAYNWLKGGEVLGPYRPSVERLIEILKSAKTADKAWEKACQEFNLQP